MVKKVFTGLSMSVFFILVLSSVLVLNSNVYSNPYDLHLRKDKKAKKVHKKKQGERVIETKEGIRFYCIPENNIRKGKNDIEKENEFEKYNSNPIIVKVNSGNENPEKDYLGTNRSPEPQKKIAQKPKEEDKVMKDILGDEDEKIDDELIKKEIEEELEKSPPPYNNKVRKNYKSSSDLDNSVEKPSYNTDTIVSNYKNDNKSTRRYNPKPYQKHALNYKNSKENVYIYNREKEPNTVDEEIENKQTYGNNNKITNNNVECLDPKERYFLAKRLDIYQLVMKNKDLLNLTPDQERLIEAKHMDIVIKKRIYMGKIDALEKRFRETVFNDNNEPQELKTLILKLAKLKAELSLLEIKEAIIIKGILNPSQWDTLKNLAL